MKTPPTEPVPLVRTAWGFYLLIALAGLLWIGLREDVIPVSLFLDLQTWWIDLGLGIGSGLVLVGVWRLAVVAVPGARELEERIAALLGHLSGDEALALAVLSGIAEELFFRGALQGSWGWIAATLLFALLHTGPGKVFGLWTLFAVVAGGLFGGLMLWRGNLLAPMLAHFVVNAINLRRLVREAAASRDAAEPETGEDETTPE
ncbi:MAG TPA: type II CAAX endopeptidase family protein [Thermoanaerobaculia bacterium]|nr:type II CAAX endopeptidase family protein [Thermoanaerobaculia bacterium]